MVENVINEYTAAVSDENSTEYREAVNIGYAEADHPLQCYYSCKWYTDKHRPTRTYDTLFNLIYEETDDLRTTFCKGLMYARDVQRYYVWRLVQRKSTRNVYILQEVNQFGPVINDNTTDAIKKELNIVPVWIEHLDEGTGGNHKYMMYLNPGELEDESSDVGQNQFKAAQEIEQGKKEKSAAHYNKLYVAFWDGVKRCTWNPYHVPYIDNINFYSFASTDKYYFTTPFTLKLKAQTKIYPIYPKTKYTISFLADNLPDPRSIFYIRGRKFVCSKLTATIIEDGVSEKVKGEFYLMKE